MSIIFLYSIFFLKQFTPIDKIFDKGEIGLLRNEIYSEIIADATSRKTYLRSGFGHIDFQKNNFFIGMQRGSSRTKDSGCYSNINIKYRFYEMYDNTNYLCYENFTTLDNGLRFGLIFKEPESNFSIYSVIGVGQGERVYAETENDVNGKKENFADHYMPTGNHWANVYFLYMIFESYCHDCATI